MLFIIIWGLIFLSKMTNYLINENDQNLKFFQKRAVIKAHQKHEQSETFSEHGLTRAEVDLTKTNQFIEQNAKMQIEKFKLKKIKLLLGGHTENQPYVDIKSKIND